MKNIDKKVVVSVVAGLALFGGIMFAVKMLPNNKVTAPVKKVADIAAT